MRGRPRLAIGIPTRNRAALAEESIRSAIQQALPPAVALDVFVSDNSTAGEEHDALRRFVSAIGDPRVRLLRAPADLPMVEHWNFLLATMLEQSEGDRFLFLTDRMFLKRNALSALFAALESTAHLELLSFGIDTLQDLAPPFRLEMQPWTGECIELEAADVLRAVSSAFLRDFLPKMLNSVARRDLLSRLVRQYGSVFSSIAPDFSFCFRALSMLDRYAYLDRSLIVQHGLDRSNGRSMSRGVETADSKDFVGRLRSEGSGLRLATPIPDLMTTGNIIMHEYVTARSTAPNPARFPDIDLPRYMKLQWEEVSKMESGPAQETAFRLLRENADLWPQRPFFFDKPTILARACVADGPRRRKPRLNGLQHWTVLTGWRGLPGRVWSRWRRRGPS